MAEIFISYSRDDRDTAHALAVALEAAGLAVWWDRELTGGGDFAAEIERHLIAAPLVIVLWSHTSVQSDFVRDEASRARDQRKLLPVRIADVPLPLGFGTLHTLDLLDWNGDPDDEAMAELLAQIREAIQQAAPTGSDGGALPAARLRRRATVDPLTRRRLQRRWVLGFGVAGVAAAGGIGWMFVADARRERELARRREQQRIALSHLERAFAHHFEAEPPDLKQAELEYRLATVNDPTLAEAFFYWGHLTVALMERQQPKPSPAQLAGLREDALERFRRSLQLTALGRGQRAVAEEQIAWLGASEPAPLARSTDAQLVAALAASPEPAPVLIESNRPSMATRPTASPTAKAPPPASPMVGLGAGLGKLFGGAGGNSGGKPSAPSPTPKPASKAVAALPTAAPSPVPRIAAEPSLAQRAQAEANALFAADRDSRLGARSMLAGNPQLAAETLPAALAAATAGLATPDANFRDGLAATLQLVTTATPAVVSSERKAIGALQRALAKSPETAPSGAAETLAATLRKADGARPAVFVQIANPRQAPLAEELVRQFEAAGYATAPIETVGTDRAPSRPEVRSHGGSDPAMARWCQQELGKLAGMPAVLRNLRDIRPANDVFEIWFDAALCAPAGRDVPGCATA
ncbi:TIR domain-containing protein [Piscinibacter sakaiensis]|uniref:TIR domain-containing protein n=1 Tax=Piscinibacter sakaiensis TaxID=1547922 RepID=UPI003AADF47E